MEAPWADAVGGVSGSSDGHGADDSLGAVSRVLAEGARRGVISSAQRDRLLDIARAEAAARAGEPEDAGAFGAERSAAFGRRRLSAVAVAYWLGAALVVFALAWFVADRWERLGPAGVLGVTLVYAVGFALAARRLADAGLRFAAGTALSLVVATVPAAAWSLMRLTGNWPDGGAGGWDDPLSRYAPYMATRRLVVSLATVLAALVALRAVPRDRVRRAALGVPLALASAFALGEAGVALTPADLAWHLGGWVMLVAGAALFALAYAVDRDAARGAEGTAGDEDFAAWLYPAAVVMLHVAAAELWSQLGPARHVAPALGLALVAAALALGRASLLVIGAADIVWYLAWLAFDVFRRALGFPLALAALGVAVIALTVLAQRRYPDVLRRVSATRTAGAVPRLPGGWLSALAPLAIALLLLVYQAPRAAVRAERLDREARVQR